VQPRGRSPDRRRRTRLGVLGCGRYDTAKANAYRALGLPFGAETTEVKQAYRRLVRSYHPDLHPGASHDERRSMSVKFSEVTAAYRALVA
jgi:DnaJ-class molecular chaperone